MSRRNTGKAMSPAEKRQYLRHLEERAARIGGLMVGLRKRMKRLEWEGSPDEYVEVSTKLNELGDMLDRYEEEIADLYCELEGIDG